jgi:hypothetical protein
LYYPEFLPDANRPAWLPGGDWRWLAADTNSAFGTLRYGNLMEVVLYDCRRFVDYKQEHAKIVPQWTEDWIIARTKAQDTVHFFHAPSLPYGWSSGKLGDWYPDLLDDKTGRLVLYEAKPGWQHGWFGQHQRFMEALSSQTKRAACVVQGDMHASAVGKITRAGELRLSSPVHAILGGTLGTGDIPFPSSYRGIGGQPSQLIGMDETLKPLEKNGFSLIDVTPDRMKFTMFAWRPPQPVEEIDTMKPVLVYEIPRKV